MPIKVRIQDSNVDEGFVKIDKKEEKIPERPGRLATFQEQAILEHKHFHWWKVKEVMIIIREKAPDKLDHTVQVAKEFPRKTLSLAKTVKEVARL